MQSIFSNAFNLALINVEVAETAASFLARYKFGHNAFFVVFKTGYLADVFSVPLWVFLFDQICIWRQDQSRFF